MDRWSGHHVAEVQGYSAMLFGVVFTIAMIVRDPSYWYLFLLYFVAVAIFGGWSVTSAEAAAESGWQFMEPVALEDPTRLRRPSMRHSPIVMNWSVKGSLMKNRSGIPYGYNEAKQTFHVYDQDRHLLTFGPTRSGEGATVIVQALLRAPHSVICIDPKGQNAAITARQRRAIQGADNVFCLNPFGLHTEAPWNLPQYRFNPLAHLSITSDNVVADVSSLAEALILTESQTQPYFDNTARDLVKLLLLHLIAERPGAATLADLRRLLTLLALGEHDEDAQKLMVRLKTSPLPFVRQPALRFLQDSRDIASSINTAITQTGFLDDHALSDPDTGTLTDSHFDMMQLKRQATTVFLILPGRYMEAYARFLRLIITTAIDQLTSEPGGHPTLMMLDEFATLQNLAAISKAFGFAAGYNLQCWAFLQDMPQLQAIYGNRWESFVANAGLLQFFTPADMTTAEYLERRGGRATVESKSTSATPFLRIPQSVNLGEQPQPLLPPEYTMSRKAHEQDDGIGRRRDGVSRSKRQAVGEAAHKVVDALPERGFRNVVQVDPW